MRRLSSTGNGFAGHVFQLDARIGFHENQTTRTPTGFTQRQSRLLMDF